MGIFSNFDLERSRARWVSAWWFGMILMGGSTTQPRFESSTHAPARPLCGSWVVKAHGISWKRPWNHLPSWELLAKWDWNEAFTWYSAGMNAYIREMTNHIKSLCHISKCHVALHRHIKHGGFPRDLGHLTKILQARMATKKFGLQTPSSGNSEERSRNWREGDWSWKRSHGGFILDGSPQIWSISIYIL